MEGLDFKRDWVQLDFDVMKDNIEDWDLKDRIYYIKCRFNKLFTDGSDEEISTGD